MADNARITELLNAGLRAMSQRQSAIANNIANAETPGYRRSDVRFQELLKEALDGRKVDLDDIEPELFQPRRNPVDAKGNDVVLEQEIGEMMKTASSYKAYMRILSKMYRQVDLAIRDRV
jgi:flagellar basal-body rod protein FlgB